MLDPSSRCWPSGTAGLEDELRDSRFLGVCFPVVERVETSARRGDVLVVLFLLL